MHSFHLLPPQAVKQLMQLAVEESMCPLYKHDMVHPEEYNDLLESGLVTSATHHQQVSVQLSETGEVWLREAGLLE